MVGHDGNRRPLRGDRPCGHPRWTTGILAIDGYRRVGIEHLPQETNEIARGRDTHHVLRQRGLSGHGPSLGVLDEASVLGIPQHQVTKRQIGDDLPLCGEELKLSSMVFGNGKPGSRGVHGCSVVLTSGFCEVVSRLQDQRPEPAEHDCEHGKIRVPGRGDVCLELFRDAVQEAPDSRHAAEMVRFPMPDGIDWA